MPNSAYTIKTLAENPQGYWLLNETSGTVAIDSSGHGNNGVLSGVAGYSQPGMLTGESDTCMSFTAAGGLAVPYTTLQPWLWQAATVEFWINLNDGSGPHYIVEAVDATSTIIYLDGAVSSGSGTGNAVVIDQSFSYAGSFTVAGNQEKVALYNYKLGPAQILAKWQLGIGGALTPYSIIIGGSAVTVVAGTLKIQNTIGRRSQMQCTVHDQSPTRHYQQFQQVQAYDQSANLVFSGYISLPTEVKPGFQPALDTQTVCIDQHYLADKRIIAKLYRDQTCGFIVNDMLTNILSQEGVTVGQIGTGPIVPIANLGYVTVAAALDALVTAASSSGQPWYWMIDQNRLLWFVPYAAITGPAVDGTQIDDGRASGFLPVVTRANPKYRNTQYIVGGTTQTGSNDETRQGDGQTRSFTFSYAMNAIPTIHTLNGSNVSLGIKGQTGFQYYWAQGDPVITQDSGQTILVSTDRLRMVYVGQTPTVFSANNAALVAAQKSLDGTSGINETSLNDNTINTQADGLAKCNQQLTQYGVQNALRFEFATRTTGFVQGQLISVTYAPLGFSSTNMLVEQVDISDQADGYNIWYTVHAVVGPYDTNWVNFFANLLAPPTIANSIDLGFALATPLFPSNTLFPGPALYPS